MIEISISKQLKEAGLEWNPSPGDYCAVSTDIEGEESDVLLLFNKMEIGPGKVLYTGSSPSASLGPTKFHSLENLVWIPRLEQILSEIEKYGWDWAVTSGGRMYLTQSYRGYPVSRRVFSNETTIESAAEALMWLMSQKK